jgi:HEAT repeat protein
VAAVQHDSREAQTLAWHLLDSLPRNALAPHGPALVRQLVSNTDKHVLVSTLTKLDPSADPDVRAALWDALDSEYWTVRHNALEALEKQPAVTLAVHVPAVLRGVMTIEDVEAPDEEEYPDGDYLDHLRLQAISLLERVDKWEMAQHMQTLLRALGNTDIPLSARAVAMHVLYLLPVAAVAPHAQLLLQALRQPDEDDAFYAEQIRDRAGDILLDLEEPCLAAMVPGLLAAAADDVAFDVATLVLSKLPSATLTEHVSTVLHVLLFRSYMPGQAGIEVLRRVDPTALAEHTSAMQGPLRHAAVRVRRNALAVLGAFPSHSISAHTEALRTLLSDTNPTVSKLAVELLGRLPIQGLADDLTSLLEKLGFAGHRAAVLSVLGKLSAPGSAAAQPVAMRLLHDPDPAVRASAIGTLARLDPSALQENTGLLLTALGDSDAQVRASAMEVLVHLPAAALAEHVPTCLQGIRDPAWSV